MQFTIKHVIMVNAIHKISNDFAQGIHDYEMRIKGKYLAMMLANKWKRHKKRFGKNLTVNYL